MNPSNAWGGPWTGHFRCPDGDKEIKSIRYNILIMKCIKILVAICCLSVSTVEGQSVNIIPQPTSVQIQNGSFQLSARATIYYEEGLKTEAEFLQGILRDEHHLKLPVAAHKKSWKKNNIYLTLSNQLATTHGQEGYTLKVDGEKIIIAAAGPAGVFYAVQSLRQILKGKDGASVISMPLVNISDTPRFSWRGFMLDEGRYFKGPDVVKELLDEMALLKMNMFHWHLTDDTGWRIEIKKYPKLTEVGSIRKESEMGTWLSDKMDGKVHSGFYTQEQIKDIIRYAEERHITIIPEIEMPGHASAAIASYPWLGTENKQIEVPTKFRIQLNVFNVANPRVIGFIHDVLDEVMALFPSKIVHIGGDEVRYDQWKASAEVREYMRKNNILTPADLQISFTNSISNYLEKKNHRMMGWNEILGGHNANNDSKDSQAHQQLSQDVIIHFWAGNPEIARNAAENGFDVVNAHSEFTYLDYDYKTTSLEKAYSFEPIPTGLPANLHDRILGLSCQMWGEWIPTVERMNEQVYPRIAAFSEIGWTKAEDKDVERFKSALPHYIGKHWENIGIVTKRGGALLG